MVMSCTIRRPKGRRAESVKHNGNRHSSGGFRFRRCSAGFCILLSGQSKGCRLPGRDPAVLTLTLLFSGSLYGTDRSGKHHPFTILDTHVTWASAPTPRTTFCVDKSGAKSTPVIAPSGFPLSILLHRNVGKTRYRSNRLPTTIALTFIAFGAAEREGLAAV